VQSSYAGERFVDEETIGPELLCERYGLTFAKVKVPQCGVELARQPNQFEPIRGIINPLPNRMRRKGRLQFCPNRGRNTHGAIELAKDIDVADQN
jgi:hypothetical protein